MNARLAPLVLALLLGAGSQVLGQPGALTLERAIELALARNPDLRRSLLQAEQSAQDRISARAPILPRLDFNASAGRVRSGGGNVLGTFINPLTGQTVTQVAATQIYGSYGYGLQLRQLVFDGGKWWNNLAAADAQLAGSRETAEEQRLATAYAAEQKFLELLRAQRSLAVLTDAAARSRDQADFTQRLFEGGRGTQADVYQARANRDNDEINRLGQEARVELARQDLALVIGADPAEPLPIEEPRDLAQDPPAPPRLDEAVERALRTRPSLRAFGHFVEAQRRALAAAKGDYFPQVSLNGSYLRNSRAAGDLTAPLDQASTLSGTINLSWNLFQGFATAAAVRKQELQVLLSENDLMNGRRGVASDVERAAAQLAAARQQARVSARAEETAREGLRLARTRQQVGVGTQLEVRDAELKLTQSALAHVNALLDGKESQAALRRAMGGGV